MKVTVWRCECGTKLTPQHSLKQFNLHEIKTFMWDDYVNCGTRNWNEKTQSNHNHWLNVFEWVTTFTTMLKGNTTLIMWYSRNNMFKKQLYLLDDWQFVLKILLLARREKVLPVVHLPQLRSHPHLPDTHQSLASTAHNLPVIRLHRGDAQVVGVQRCDRRAGS